MRTLSFSETSETAAARLSGCSPGSAGKALEDQGQDHAAGKRGAHGSLGTVGGKGGSEAAGGGVGCDVVEGRRGPGRGGLIPDRFLRRLLARRRVGHSGGSSPNTRIQIMAATRVDTSVASAPNPASMPDQSRRLTKGLSVIVEAFKQTRACRRVRGRWCRRSSTWRAPARRRR